MIITILGFIAMILVFGYLIFKSDIGWLPTELWWRDEDDD